MKFKAIIDVKINDNVFEGGSFVPGFQCRLSVRTDAPLSERDHRKAVEDAICCLNQQNYKRTPDQFAVTLQEVRPTWDVEVLAENITQITVWGRNEKGFHICEGVYKL